jgi:hypothetical protein
MLTIDPVLIGWAAGIIDGEGSVMFSRRGSGGRRLPVVSVTSTSSEMLQYLQQNFGGSVSHHTSRSERWNEAWSWKLCYDRALRFLRLVTPYLVETKKRARAEYLLAGYKDLTPRNGKYTPELYIQRIAFEERFFELTGG